MIETFRRLAHAAAALRVRLAVGIALVVVVTAALVLGALREGARLAMLEELDRQLREDAEEIALGLQDSAADELQGLTDELTRKAIGHKQHGWFVEFLRPDGSAAWASPSAPGASLADPGARGHRAYSVGNYRVFRRSVATAHHPEIAGLRVGATLALIREDLGRIDRQVVIVATGVLVLAPLGAYWLAGRTAAIVGEITRTAAGLRPDRLRDRLPVRGTGDELDQLALTVNGLLDRIASYIDQKRDYLADAAHELRTPLAAIRSSVEVALAAARSREEYEELLVQIIDECRTLETLVSQVLLISESEAHGIEAHHEQVDLRELVARSVEMFRGVAESSDIALDFRACEAVWVRGVRGHLRQLVNNLIDNALKYTPPGGRVDVQLSRLPGQPLARLIVRDTGMGIAAADVPRVFDRFFRADAARGRGQPGWGAGLGLSICQAVATAHRGRITCTSAPGAGSTFTVELPCSDEAALFPQNPFDRHEHREQQ